MQTPAAPPPANSSPPINRMLFSSMQKAFVSDGGYSEELTKITALKCKPNSRPPLHPPHISRMPLTWGILSSPTPIPRSPFLKN